MVLREITRNRSAKCIWTFIRNGKKKKTKKRDEKEKDILKFFFSTKTYASMGVYSVRIRNTVYLNVVENFIQMRQGFLLPCPQDQIKLGTYHTSYFEFSGKIGLGLRYIYANYSLFIFYFDISSFTLK